MTNFRIATAALLFLLSNVGVSAADEDSCAPFEDLGTPSLEQFDFTEEMSVNLDDCEYSVAFKFKHEESLPIPSDPPAQCNPTIVPPEIASDGKPYFAFRWFYDKVSEDVKTVTGIDHVSVDWNPCGHPPVEKFGAPHYDLHIYRETPEFRTCMTCTKPPGAPICDPTPGSQTTASGLAFFNVTTADIDLKIERSFDPVAQPINMPAGFVVGIADMVPLMGGHAWDPNSEPPSNLEWVDPVWIMGPYAGTIVDYEPMIPFQFMNGESKEWKKDLVYEGQTIEELPSSYCVEYDSETGYTTLTLSGPAPASYCEEKIAAAAVVDSSSSSYDKGVAPVLLSLVFTSVVSLLL